MGRARAKKAEMRFSIQFRQDVSEHLRVVEILNQQGRYKAQYVVDAILFYEKYHTLDAPRSALDEKQIEAIVNKILSSRIKNSTDVLPTTSARKAEKVPQTNANTVIIDEVVEVMGQDNLNAIAGTLNMFRKK